MRSLQRRGAADDLHQLGRDLRLAGTVDAIVLDLHCDDDALMHLYMLETHSTEAEIWGRELASAATLLSDDSGGGAFDETFSVPWLQLAKAFPDLPIPAHCKAATVELRGYGDVFDEINKTDAEALYHILQHQGFIEGDPIDQAWRAAGELSA